MMKILKKGFIVSCFVIVMHLMVYANARQSSLTGCTGTGVKCEVKIDAVDENGENKKVAVKSEKKSDSAAVVIVVNT